MRTPKALLTLTAAAALGAAGGATVLAVAGGGHTVTTTIEAAPAPGVATSAPAGGLTAAQVYDRAKDSVAFVTAKVGQQGEATGSGFVVSGEGLIVTNAHVVANATSIAVKVGDGAARPATVLGRDESTDIALLKLAGRSQGLTPLPFADSSKLQVGDATYAIGNPFGLDRTLTTGVVSALQRQISAPNGFSIDGAVQTDAPINPGNSGGPLLDARGRVIGITSQIETGGGGNGNVGIGFAVPSNTVRGVIAQLERSGHVVHAYLGVQSGDASEGAGAQVAAVAGGGPAQRAGVHAGDVIVSFDGKRVADAAALSTFVNAHQAGDRVSVTVRRGGGEQTLSVTLGTQPAQASGSAPAGQAPGQP